MWPEIVAARFLDLRLVVTYGWEGLRTWDSGAGVAGALQPGGGRGQGSVCRL